MTDDEQVWFAKVDSDLDNNPKIKRAGALARDVYEFVLRVNARTGSRGWIKLSRVAPDYLADQLMVVDMVSSFIMALDIAISDGLSLRSVTRDACDAALRACVTHELLSIDTELKRVSIVGWTDQWGRRASSGGQRQKRYRDKQSKSQEAEPSSDGKTSRVTESDDRPSRVTTSDASDVREEKRREEKKTKRSPLEGLSGFRQVTDCFDSLFESAYGTKPTWGPRQAKNIKSLLAKHPADEICRRVNIMFTSDRDWPKPPYDIGTLVACFDRFAAPEIPNKPSGRREVERPGPDLQRIIPTRTTP